MTEVPEIVCNSVNFLSTPPVQLCTLLAQNEGKYPTLNKQRQTVHRSALAAKDMKSFSIVPTECPKVYRKSVLHLLK